MKRILTVAALAFSCLVSNGMTATDGALKGALDVFEKTPAIQGTSWGFAAVTLGGDTLATRNATVRLVPASNVKTITLGAALHSLGPSYRFKTTLAHSGTVEDGVLKGDLYILGGGDPTMASKHGPSVPLDTLFGQWLALRLRR